MAPKARSPEITVTRDEHGRWIKGVSGQGSRAKGVEKRILALTHNGEDILWTLARAARGELPGQTAHDQVDAANKLADRVWGKAVERTVNVDVDLDSSGAPDLVRQLATILAPYALPPDETVDALPTSSTAVERLTGTEIPISGE